MKNIFKKTLAIIIVVTVIFTNVPVYVFAIAPDSTIPTVAISGITTGLSIENGGSLTLEVYFDDESALGSVYLPVENVITNGFSANISISGTGSLRVVTLTNIQGAGTGKSVTIAAGSATDTSGNKSKALTTRTFTINPVDSTIPTVAITKPDPSTVQVGGTVKYTVYFDDERELKSVNFNADYVKLNGFTATKTISGTGDTRVVTLSNIQSAADGDNYITVLAGAATDAAGNKSKSLNSSKFTVEEKIVVDSTIPTVAITKPDPLTVQVGGTVKYIVYFDDERELKSVNFNADYVKLNGFTATKTISGTGDTRVVTLSNIQSAADGDNYITVLAGAATDAAGNKTKALNSSKFTVKEKEIVKEPEEVVEEPKIIQKDTIKPVVKIGSPDLKTIYSGGTVKYNVTFSDNVKVTNVNLLKSKIDLVGFTADISIQVNGLQSAIITLNNIKGNVGVNKYIKIDSGVALDAAGNRSVQAISPKFSIINKTLKVEKTVRAVTKYTLNCIDDLSLLGDINKEITYFASWIRAEKYTATYAQENNYVAENETMTYMVEYYNGSTAPAPNVTFDLTIPYKVDIEEINGNGKISKQSEKETVITWDIGEVPSYAASTGKGCCRLYVRVKFLENEKLKASDKISETFYTTLKTTANGNRSYSYMRQLFIDTTEGKTGTYKKYLTTVDTTNQIRPNDEITRAEFAKLLADSGILDVKIGSTSYKTFKDYESIPAYARDAVSALVKTDIIQAFPDGEFKPNNPILMEDAIQMLAQASTYISDQKLTVNKPVFLYTEALTGDDKKISDKKEYIMELMRQNVIVKYDSNPDSYALRKDVVAMVNALTFRGPYVETLPENTLKFADIRDDSVFFYNIVGASNSYTYTYDYRLWQQIISVE